MAVIYHLPTNHFLVIQGLKLLILFIKEKNRAALWRNLGKKKKKNVRKENLREIRKSKDIMKWMSHGFR